MAKAGAVRFHHEAEDIAARLTFPQAEIFSSRFKS
jgi:hypothetical protein